MIILPYSLNIRGGKFSLILQFWMLSAKILPSAKKLFLATLLNLEIFAPQNI